MKPQIVSTFTEHCQNVEIIIEGVYNNSKYTLMNNTVMRC